jgi:hypothetical protein
MTLEELAMSAIKAINQKSYLGWEGTPYITLQMPPQKREAPKRHLSGRNSPLGNVLSRMEGYDVVAFPAVDVLAWCVAMSDGAIKVNLPEGGQ